MTEEADTQTSGLLDGRENIYYKEGSNQPRFRGTLNTDGNAEKRSFTLWVGMSKKGETYLSGTVSDTAKKRLEKMATGEADISDEEVAKLTLKTATGLEVKPHEMILFEAKNHDPVKKQPELYGYYNPGDGQSLQKVDVWMRNIDSRSLGLSGKVSAYDVEMELAKVAEKQKQMKDDAGNDNQEEEEENERKKKRSRGR